MAFNELQGGFASPNILESEIGLVTKTRTATQSMAVEIGGKKILKAGTLFTGENEQGVVFQDYDMTVDASYPIAVVFQGRLRADRVADEVVAKKSDFAAQGLYLIEPVGASNGTTENDTTGD